MSLFFCFPVHYLCSQFDKSKKILNHLILVLLFLVVLVSCARGFRLRMGVYWVISCFWGSCTVTLMLEGCFWVLVCWFPVQNRVQPIVQRMRIRGRRRRMSVRLRIWVQPVMVGCARVGDIAFMNFGYELVLRLGWGLFFVVLVFSE